MLVDIDANKALAAAEKLRERIARGAMQGSEFLATKAFDIGQNTFQFLVGFFVMLYLLYFFLRDGPELVRLVRTAVPLEDSLKRRLQIKFTRVVRATVKGNLVVAAVQGVIPLCRAQRSIEPFDRVAERLVALV